MSPNPTKTPLPSSLEEDTSDRESESPWTLEDSCTDISDESEVELFALDTLPQVVTDSMSFLEDDSVVPARIKKILKLVQFGPTLQELERQELWNLVTKFADLFVSKHRDLPNITIEQHKIELQEGAKFVRVKQRRMVLDKINILKAELDRLLEGGFITQVTNTEWVSPVVIVLKKGGKWRICVNYKTLNVVTKKDHQPLPFIYELLDDIVGHVVYSFFDRYNGSGLSLCTS